MLGECRQSTRPAVEPSDSALAWTIKDSRRETFESAANGLLLRKFSCGQASCNILLRPSVPDRLLRASTICLTGLCERPELQSPPRFPIVRLRCRCEDPLGLITGKCFRRMIASVAGTAFKPVIVGSSEQRRRSASATVPGLELCWRCERRRPLHLWRGECISTGIVARAEIVRSSESRLYWPDHLASFRICGALFLTFVEDSGLDDSNFQCPVIPGHRRCRKPSDRRVPWTINPELTPIGREWPPPNLSCAHPHICSRELMASPGMLA